MEIERSYECLNLKNQLCFPLYACAKEIVRSYSSLLAPLGLTYTQYITMMVLWEEEELTVKALGEHLYLDSGTLTPLLKKLEEKGLVTRTRSKIDERNLIVRVTAEGLAMQEAAAEIPSQFRDSLRLSDEEYDELHRLLYKVLGQLGEE